MRVKEFVKRLAAKIADVINGCPDCEKEREEFWKTFESDKPYKDLIKPRLEKNTKMVMRMFPPDTPAYLLKWHADETDRVVHVLSDTDWKFQFDNELPFDLTLGKRFKIPKGKIHRLIKESDTPLALNIEITL